MSLIQLSCCGLLTIIHNNLLFSYPWTEVVVPIYGFLMRYHYTKEIVKWLVVESLMSVSTLHIVDSKLAKIRGNIYLVEEILPF